MAYYDEDREEEEPKTVETVMVTPGDCSICGRPEQSYGCFSCGQPVCYNLQDYWSSSDCGGWILDSWHPEHPEGNEFYCNFCLHANLIPRSVGVDVSTVGTIVYGPGETLQIILNHGALVGERTIDLTLEETRNLVAYLYSERGELFGKKYDPNAVAEVPQTPVAALDDFLGDLDDHPF